MYSNLYFAIVIKNLLIYKKAFFPIYKAVPLLLWIFMLRFANHFMSFNLRGFAPEKFDVSGFASPTT